MCSRLSWDKMLSSGHDSILIHLYTIRQNQEYRIYKTLLQMIPGLEDRLVDGGEAEIHYCSKLVCDFK